MSQETTRRFDAPQLHRQVVAILRAWGMPDESAEATATVMVETDLSGIDSHGVSMLMMYEKLLHEDRLKLDAVPRVIRDTPALAVVDAGAGLGHPAGLFALELAIQKAGACGIGAVAVGNSHHLGALGYYVRSAAQRGLVALMTTTTRTPVVAAAGGTTPILGTNPLAFAAPRAGGAELVIDMSTSVVAMNKVKAYALGGRDLPVGWVVDRGGRTITDASLAYSLLTTQGATLTPLGGSSTETGGHKGFGLSLMVHVLSGAFSGAALPLDDGDSDNLGHFVLVIDPNSGTGGGSPAGYVDDLVRLMSRDEPGVVIPGDPEAEAHTGRSRDGIPVPESLLEHLRAVCGRAGTDMILTPVG
ncbi:Ldh family oxidoreductase [Arthrobacter sp. Br18]|uniref:Ldh family oxidoreductase n=1 Tax=Arthrobacter sp. Br18 TaxID=1312954 RepID=UPI00047BE32C|nr:Ldh family oxidoreductase [Arthrobacter sp. Br18]